jgi:transcriptional regulator with XRE-family HTH domain
MTLGLFIVFVETNAVQHDALRLIRIFHDLTQTALAESLSISKSYLSEIESGKKTPTLELLEKYAETFNMPLSSLLFFAENLVNPTRSDKVRAVIANKAIKMLEWIAVKDEVA